MACLMGNTKNGVNSPDGIAILGFGRGEGVNRYLKGGNKFVIGMYPKSIVSSSDHEELSEFIEMKFLND